MPGSSTAAATRMPGSSTGVDGALRGKVLMTSTVRSGTGVCTAFGRVRSRPQGIDDIRRGQLGCR